MQNKKNNIKEIVIIGGGTAGWMSATYLATSMNFNMKITVIESPDHKNSKEKKEIAAVAEKIRNEMEKPFMIDSNAEKISVSIGIAIYPDDAKNAEQLIKLSDETMYRVKQSTRNAFDFVSTIK